MSNQDTANNQDASGDQSKKPAIDNCGLESQQKQQQQASAQKSGDAGAQGEAPEQEKNSEMEPGE